MRGEWKLHLFVAVIAVLVTGAAILFYLDTGSDATELSQVTDQECSFQDTCGEGYTCRDFPETDGPRCAKENSFDYYRCPIGTRIVIQQSYPSTLRCMPRGFLGRFR